MAYLMPEQPETWMDAGQRVFSKAPACAHALEQAYTGQITQQSKPTERCWRGGADCGEDAPR
eukprot:6211157-Pleurochrysis_carterae.AAC.1